MLGVEEFDMIEALVSVLLNREAIQEGTILERVLSENRFTNSLTQQTL